MTPAEVQTMPDHEIVELLVSLRPSDPSVAWLASIIASPAKIAGVNELARRYDVSQGGGSRHPRAKHADSVCIDGARFKEFFWTRRIPLREVGPLAGKCEGLGSVIAHRGPMSFWTADAIANELGLHVDAFLAQVASPVELERLGVS